MAPNQPQSDAEQRACREAFERAGYWPNEVMWKAWQQAWTKAAEMIDAAWRERAAQSTSERIPSKVAPNLTYSAAVSEKDREGFEAWLAQEKAAQSETQPKAQCHTWPFPKETEYWRARALKAEAELAVARAADGGTSEALQLLREALPFINEAFMATSPDLATPERFEIYRRMARLLRTSQEQPK